jgi:dipeptidyl aminopeptidase/acylaminoacyl peptidase
MTDFDFDRFLSLPRLSKLRLSPDGTRLVASVERPAPDGKKMRAAIWELDPDGERAPRRLTASATGEGVGAFLPDGSLVFASGRPDPDRADDKDEEKAGLWLLPAAGGEARLLVAPGGGVDDVKAARASHVVVFGASVFPRAATLKEDAEQQEARKKAGVEALLFDDYPIRRWDHYLGPRERHLYAAAVPADGPISEPVDLTPHAGNALLETDFDITPDGETVVAGWIHGDDLTSRVCDLIAIDRHSGARRTITPGDAWYGEVAISPDGRSVACVRYEMGDPDHAPDSTLWLIDLDAGEGRDVAAGFDLWPVGPVWTVDGSAILFTADRRGNTALFRFDVASGAITLLAGEGEYHDPCPTPDGGRVYALRATQAVPPGLVQLGADGREHKPRSLTTFPELAEPGTSSIVDRVETQAEDGTTVESWLVRPADSGPERPAPLVVWVHGGPIGSWVAWHWRWNPHLLAARGYAVLLPDPALSTGYGHAFLQRGWGRWGEAPFTDVMAAFEGVVGRDDLDTDRASLMGGSFGGYMANWVAGKSDRFKGIVTHASLWELRTFHGTTDDGPAWEKEFGDPYADAARYEAVSPHQFLERVRTPLLIVAGEKDYRVPVSEALRMWTDLKRHGADARFLYFPDENHWVLKPQNARLWYETVLAFLDERVRGEEFRRPKLL